MSASSIFRIKLLQIICDIFPLLNEVLYSILNLYMYEIHLHYIIPDVNNIGGNHRTFFALSFWSNELMITNQCLGGNNTAEEYTNVRR